MPLTDTAIKAVKPRATAYKLADGGGFVFWPSHRGVGGYGDEFRHQRKRAC